MNPRQQENLQPLKILNHVNYNIVEVFLNKNDLLTQREEKRQSC